MKKFILKLKRKFFTEDDAQSVKTQQNDIQSDLVESILRYRETSKSAPASFEEVTYAVNNTDYKELVFEKHHQPNLYNHQKTRSESNKIKRFDSLKFSHSHPPIMGNVTSPPSRNEPTSISKTDIIPRSENKISAIKNDVPLPKKYYSTPPSVVENVSEKSPCPEHHSQPPTITSPASVDSISARIDKLTLAEDNYSVALNSTTKATFTWSKGAKTIISEIESDFLRVQNQNEIRTTQIAKTYKRKTTIPHYDFIYEICKCKLVKIGKDNFKPTSKVKYVLQQTKPVYESANEYRDIYGSLLCLETIKSVFQLITKETGLENSPKNRDWVTVQKLLQCPPDFRTFVDDNRFYSALFQYDLNVSNFNDEKTPLVNSLICIEYKGKYDFAFIEAMQSNKELDFSKRAKGHPKKIIATLTLRVAMIAPIFHKGGGHSSSIRVRFISRLSTVFKMYKSLFSLELSPFLEFLLNPLIPDVSSPCAKNNLLLGIKLNKEQKEAALSISEQILANPSQPMVRMIHGPPGTGKTKTISALIGQVYKMSTAKLQPLKPIMVCTPSNAAADELAMRIIGLKNYGIQLKIKRIGMEHKIRTEILPYCLDDSKTFKEKQSILSNSDVIVSTLSSSYSNLTKSLQLSCCIIDEAGQCHEPEVLIPFLLKFSKLVLIGDQKQLSATIICNRAAEHGLKISMFERFYNYANETNRLSGIHRLVTQYRMHRSIVSWPSQYFYENTLITPDDITSGRSYNIEPYMIFDLKFTHEVKMESSTSNYLEAKFIDYLCHKIIPHVKATDIGIITPYNAQRVLLKEKLKDLPEVKISTVDMFQGQEKEVIIFSCVRANGRGDIGFLRDLCRLNVALTRAKRSCFIIGNLYTLDNHPGWRSLIKDANKRGKICTVHMDRGTKAIPGLITNKIFIS